MAQRLSRRRHPGRTGEPAAVSRGPSAQSRPARRHQQDRLHDTLVARRTGTILRRERARGASARRAPATARHRIRPHSVLDVPVLSDLLRAAARRRSRDSAADGRRGSAHLGRRHRPAVLAADRVSVSDAGGSAARPRPGLASARAVVGHRVRRRSGASSRRRRRSLGGWHFRPLHSLSRAHRAEQGMRDAAGIFRQVSRFGGWQEAQGSGQEGRERPEGTSRMFSS